MLHGGQGAESIRRDWQLNPKGGVSEGSLDSLGNVRLRADLALASLGTMQSLIHVREQVDELSAEDRQGLLAYLIHSLPSPPVGADDHEIMQREAEMDAGEVLAISHQQFLSEVGRG